MGVSGRIVFSTEKPAPCPRCGAETAACTCRDASRVPDRVGAVRVGRETKGRRGKGVTVVSNLPLRGPALEELARDLKRLCGSGGTVREDGLEIQGDHRDRLVAELERRGFAVKRAGG